MHQVSVWAGAERRARSAGGVTPTSHVSACPLYILPLGRLQLPLPARCVELLLALMLTADRRRAAAALAVMMKTAFGTSGAQRLSVVTASAAAAVAEHMRYAVAAIPAAAAAAGGFLLPAAAGAENGGGEGLGPAWDGEEPETARNFTSSVKELKMSLEEMSLHVEAEWGSHVDDDTEFLDSVTLYVNGFLAVYTTATKLN